MSRESFVKREKEYISLQPVYVGTSNNRITEKDKTSISNKLKYARKKKRKFVYLEKTK